MHVRVAPLITLLSLALALDNSTARAQEGARVRGRVIEAGAHVPIVGAELSTGDGRTVVSGQDGAFQLGPLTQSGTIITVRHVAYAQAQIRITQEDATRGLVVELTPRPVSLDALVVTAARRQQRLKDVAVATEVLAREELRETGASDLSAVLIERTGVSAEGGHPVGSGVMLQGLGSERVLVLLDGQPYVGRISGRLDISRIPTSMVDRVEVVKGPQSTLYGSDAMGGVINVITRSPARGALNGGIDVVGGTRGRLDVGADVRGGGGDLGFIANAGRRTVELVPGSSSDAGTLATRWDGMAKASWHPRPGFSMAAAGLLLDERQRWRSGQLYNFADNLQWGGRASALWTGGRHRLAPMLYATEFRHLSRSATSATPVEGSGEEERQRLLEAEVLYGLDLGALAVDGGLEAKRESIRSDRVRDANRTLHSLEPFLQGTLTGAQWSIVPGARLSWSEQWGASWTPRLAALFRPADRLALRASVGRGYRAPDFKELYMEFLNVGPGFGYVVRGNPDLQPESSRNLSGSIEWAGDRVYLRAQAFHNRFRDFIETREVGDSSGVTVFTYGNIDDGITRGLELEAGATWRGLRAEAGWGWLAAKRAGTGEELLGRPAQSGRASLAYAWPFGLRASMTGVYTGDTPVRREGDALIERAAFGRFDGRVAQSLPGALEMTFGIDNIADVRPADWPGFLGRQFYLGLSWRTGRERSALEFDN